MEDQGFIRREEHGDLRDLIGRPHEHRATITVGADDVITTAHNRLRNAGFSQLPVMEGDRLVGVITEDDIIRLAFGRPVLMAEPVRLAMRTRFLRVDKDTSLDNLVALLHGDSYAAVTDQGGQRFLGLITRSDVLNYLRRLHQRERDEQ
jgi:cystathionine beta-synthase